MLKTNFTNCKLILGITDSLYAVVDDPDQNFISKLKSLSPWYDFSNLPKTLELYCTENESKHGFWKLCSLDVLEVI